MSLATFAAVHEPHGGVGLIVTETVRCQGGLGPRQSFIIDQGNWSRVSRFPRPVPWYFRLEPVGK
jgi:hypothetical protein